MIVIKVNKQKHKNCQSATQNTENYNKRQFSSNTDIHFELIILQPVKVYLSMIVTLMTSAQLAAVL